MKRIAAPMVGGVTTSFLLELLIYPVIFTVWKWHAGVKHAAGRTDHHREFNVRDPAAFAPALARPD